MRAQLKELVDEKVALVERMSEQMKGDVEAGVLHADTVKLIDMAGKNFTASIERIEEKTEKADSEALYFFGRGNWNLGEFQARAKIEKLKNKKE